VVDSIYKGKICHGSTSKCLFVRGIFFCEYTGGEMKSVIIAIAAVFCFYSIILAEDLVKDDVSTVMPAVSTDKTAGSSWRTAQDAIAEGDGTVVNEVSNDGTAIRTQDTVDGQKKTEYILNLETGVITLGAPSGASARVLRELTPEEYQATLAQMIETVTGALSQDSLSEAEIAFLNETKKTLISYQTSFIAELTSGDPYHVYTVKNNGTTISTYSREINALTTEYNLDMATGTITYIPHPYGEDEPKKAVTLKRADNPAEYNNAMQLMINTVDKALTAYNASTLSKQQIQFLENNKLVLSGYKDGTIHKIPVMPGISALTQTDSARAITVTFTNGTLSPLGLSGLWAKVSYDGKIKYWKLDPSMLSADGKTFTMKFGAEFNDKTMTMSLYGFAAFDNSKTSFSNEVTFLVHAQGTITMPSISGPSKVYCDSGIDLTFASPILPDSLSELWAKVTIDGKTEYRKLSPALMSEDGMHCKLQFDHSLAGKTLTLQLYGIEKATGVQTNLSNGVTFEIIGISPSIPMPVTLPAAVTANVNRTAVITFASGTLVQSTIKDLWAQVNYDGRDAEYWDLDPSMISADGKSMEITFDPSFAGKTVLMRIYAFNYDGTQTQLSNSITITIPEASISEVSVGVPYYMRTISNNGTTITTYLEAISLKSWPYFMDIATGTITYTPYPYTWEGDPSKMVTLTRLGNPEGCASALEHMIAAVEDALTCPQASTLTEEQITFLNQTDMTLRSLLR